MNDDLTLLASAYLDGDVTADERARVESDPQLLGEVERLRSVRTARRHRAVVDLPARTASGERPRRLGHGDGDGTDSTSHPPR